MSQGLSTLTPMLFTRALVGMFDCIKSLISWFSKMQPCESIEMGQSEHAEGLDQQSEHAEHGVFSMLKSIVLRIKTGLLISILLVKLN